MKKFHFYLVTTEPGDIRCGLDLGILVRNRRRLRWAKKNIKGYKDVVKVTLWLSQKLLKSISKAKISGSVWIAGANYKPAPYTHKNVIRAIRKHRCYDPAVVSVAPDNAEWFARAKVEKV